MMCVYIYIIMHIWRFPKSGATSLHHPSREWSWRSIESHGDPSWLTVKSPIVALFLDLRIVICHWWWLERYFVFGSMSFLAGENGSDIRQVFQVWWTPNSSSDVYRGFRPLHPSLSLWIIMDPAVVRSSQFVVGDFLPSFGWFFFGHLSNGG